MKAILEYDLPDDSEVHLLAVNAANLYSSLWDMDQELRKLLKYGNDLKTADEALERMREFLRETMADHGVSLDMVS